MGVGSLFRRSFALFSATSLRCQGGQRFLEWLKPSHPPKDSQSDANRARHLDPQSSIEPCFIFGDWESKQTVFIFFSANSSGVFRRQPENSAARACVHHQSLAVTI